MLVSGINVIEINLAVNRMDTHISHFIVATQGIRSTLELRSLIDDDAITLKMLNYYCNELGTRASGLLDEVENL